MSGIIRPTVGFKCLMTSYPSLRSQVTDSYGRSVPATALLESYDRDRNHTLCEDWAASMGLDVGEEDEEKEEDDEYE